ncbi:ankyrin repeat domain-containing protein 50 [Elysia marginata]|uniref:Ankyrin repeat domain-containing protein 50 n=1 Tax=Elysia marginata TaxID=1093978 RepID=A0AAV4H154_9GAST|nr:ankyrin repeat domain-containing protein 50 [Elysia marginata]
MLLEQGAKVNEVDNDGRIALIQASQEGHLEVVQRLVEAGSTVNHRAHDGKTAMRVAAVEGHVQVVDFLLTAGTDINYLDADGRSTLYVLALDGNMPMTRLLLSRGALVEAVDVEGRTALHVASWQGNVQVVQALIQHGADVNSEDNDRRTAVQSASWQGHGDVVRILLEAGARADHTCNQGATALCIAAQEGHEDVVSTLLAYQANPNHADQFGRTPYRVALKSGHHKVCKILEGFGAVLPPGINRTSSPSSGAGLSSDCEETKANKNTKSSNQCKMLVENRPKKDGKKKVKTSGNENCFKDVEGTTSGVKNIPTNGNIVAQQSSATSSTIMALTGSPEMPSERRKSYHSYNSKSSSSNMTSSTNQSGGGGSNLSRQDRECLTFTQQLQQCTMGKNRTRPISRVLSPVSEPQSPVLTNRSPSSSQPPALPSHPPPPALTKLGPWADTSGGYCEIHTGLGVQIISSSRKTVDKPNVGNENALLSLPPPLPPKGPGLSLNRTHAMLASSNSAPAGSSSTGSPSMKLQSERRVSATINIITNPHADMMSSVEEPVWQHNPEHPAKSTDLHPSNSSYVQNYHNNFIHDNQQPQRQQQQQFQKRHNGANSIAVPNNFLTTCSSSSSSSGSHHDVGSHHHNELHCHQHQQPHLSVGSSPRIIMGQSFLTNKSQERCWKRNGIVTNPKAMQTPMTTTNNSKNYARSVSNSSSSSTSNSIPQQFRRFSSEAASVTSNTLISLSPPSSNCHPRKPSFSQPTFSTNNFESLSPTKALDSYPRALGADGKATGNAQASCGEESLAVKQSVPCQQDFSQQAGVNPVRPNGLPLKKLNSPRLVQLCIVGVGTGHSGI